MGKKHGYGVVIDAGSSGSRVYIYEYKRAAYVQGQNDVAELARLPHIKTVDEYKKHPGIATFGSAPERVGDEHLRELVEYARSHVPSDEIERTPIFLLATAGVRLLQTAEQTALLEHSCAYLRRSSRFLLPDCELHVQAIPGETEGLYGWIAANYLLGGFDSPEQHNHGKGHHTYGFLDMGGASAQIAFAPNATEAARHADDLKLLRLRTVGGDPRDFRVFVNTWLGFGANEARRRYVDRLFATYPNQLELPDPCLPRQITVDRLGGEVEEDSGIPHLLGTGNFAECLRNTYPLLEKDHVCFDQPCLLNGVHTPAIDFDVNHFVGVSEYWHTTHEIFSMAHKDSAYDLLHYQEEVTELCSRDWADIEHDVARQKWGKKVDARTVEEACFKASWLINMLHEGIGVPRIGQHTNSSAALDAVAGERGFLDPFQAVDKIDGTELTWTLGKMLLYASSQMPPDVPDALPVGFGSNVAGHVLPPDFQRPVGASFLYPQNLTSTHWQDGILSSGYSRHWPGLLILLLILVFAAFLVCGRERRQSIYAKLQTRLRLRSRRRRPGTPGSLLSSKFLSREPAYERILESGRSSSSTNVNIPTLYEPNGSTSNDWDLDSETSTRSSADALELSARSSRAFGLATPAARSLSPDLSRHASHIVASYYDGSGAGTGSGSAAHPPLLPPPQLPFSQLPRTQSRERFVAQRLAVSTAQAGSRSSSPRRGSPLVPFKENVD